MATAASSTTPNAPTPTRHELGPLLTFFEPHIGCQKPTLLSTTIELATDTRTAYAARYRETWTAWDFMGDPGDPGRARCPTASGMQCMPPSATRQGAHAASRAFYSPGVFCPSGWATEARVVATKSDPFSRDQGIDRSTLMPDETVHVCCPSYFQFAPESTRPHGRECFQTSTYFDHGHYGWACRTDTPGFSLSQGTTGQVMGSTATMVNGVAMTIPIIFDRIEVYAPSIQLNYRGKDLGGRITPGAPQSWSADSDSPSATSGGGRLGQEGAPGHSSGVIAAIVVGALIAFFLLCTAAAAVFIHARKQAAKADKPDEADEVWYKPELESAACDHAGVRSELEVCERYELAGSTCFGTVQELDAESPKGELPTYEDTRDIKSPMTTRTWSW